ncbi:hypothetical protein HaLaN_16224 [Haematococcus lacustris]|uniref:Uncharacterized protein n=1 Tax=Haematococcus lacustris TaxID=44745 RepID=A0A699ZL80_HAELA|nr:hypothetical protein HaLaN_16224 [Haematococcus lacustris]
MGMAARAVAGVTCSGGSHAGWKQQVLRQD